MRECNIFQRVEKKYMITQEQYELFMDTAGKKITEDEYGLHTISNIYYDTESYELIRQSIEKPKYKEKFQLRGYGQVTDNSTVFLEIKKKYEGIVYKRRTALSLKEAKSTNGIPGMACKSTLRIRNLPHIIFKIWDSLQECGK